jgi:hypothetical protein
MTINSTCPIGFVRSDRVGYCISSRFQTNFDPTKRLEAHGGPNALLRRSSYDDVIAALCESGVTEHVVRELVARQ